MKNEFIERVVDDKQMDVDVTKRELEQLLVYDVRYIFIFDGIANLFLLL